MRVFIEPGKANTSDKGVQPDDKEKIDGDHDGERGTGCAEQGDPESSTTEKRGNPDGADSEPTADRVLRDNKRRAEGVPSEPAKLSRGWQKVPAGTVETTLDDSQPPPENTAG